MTAHEFEVLGINNSTLTNDDEYSIPIDISDIINICREYTKLTWQMQNQIESILDLGVDEAIKTGSVQRTSLIYIKDFLLKICDNAYFGDAVSQAYDCVKLIQQYEENNQIKLISNFN